jgi:SAM-dependent methyltransferase
MTSGRCRFCGAPLATTFCDLGVSPLANSYLRAEDLARMEPFYPLHAFVCDACLLVQLEEFASPADIFGDYAYLSSVSESWLAHCRAYADSAIARFGLGPKSLVVEVASNDGYLLRWFKDRNVRVLGIEPAKNVAAVAEANGIPTLCRFFGEALAQELRSGGTRADLVAGNNVLAHVPDLNDFVRGLATLLADDGVLTMEFPHLLRLIEGTQFDTIYHEHFSYFSFAVAVRVFAAHGLEAFDVDELPTHGGSLRVYAKRAASAAHAKTPRVERLLAAERAAGLDRIETYRGFEEKVRRTKRSLLRFLVDSKERGLSTVGYGAPAKGNTLLNYCGVRTDLLDYTVDMSPLKQGRFLPGTRIPVFAPERLKETRPDQVLVLPWNIAEEVTRQHAYVRGWGGRFVVPVPEARVLG